LHALPPGVDFAAIRPNWWNHLGHPWYFDPHSQRAWGWRAMVPQGMPRRPPFKPLYRGAKLVLDNRFYRKAKPRKGKVGMRLVAALREATKRRLVWGYGYSPVPLMWDYMTPVMRAYYERLPKKAHDIIFGHWDREDREYVPGLPAIYIGEVSFLKAALLEDPSFIPDTVSQVCDALGDYPEVLTREKADAILAAFDAPEHEYYERGNRDEVAAWLEQHLGWQVFAVGH
jgi:hypothetical protein